MTGEFDRSVFFSFLFLLCSFLSFSWGEEGLVYVAAATMSPLVRQIRTRFLCWSFATLTRQCNAMYLITFVAFLFCFFLPYFFFRSFHSSSFPLFPFRCHRRVEHGRGTIFRVLMVYARDISVTLRGH